MRGIFSLMSFICSIQWILPSSGIYLPSFYFGDIRNEACYIYEWKDGSNRTLMMCKNINILSDSIMLLKMASPKELTYIGFENTSLPLITSPMFSDFANLLVLDLKKSNIVVIHSKTFGNLTNLEELYLQHNDIVQFKRETFTSLESLKILDISSNSLKTIEKYHFQNLAKLKVLNMSNNDLHSLNPDCFASLISLETLVLTNNNIICEPLYIPSQNLKLLLFDDNKLYTFPVTGDLTQVTHLDVSYNSLSEISLQLHPLFSLTSANLSHNKIERILISHFRNFNLRELDLSYNLIEWISETLFQNLTVLEKLHLNNNRIKYFASGSLANLQNLTYLSLSFNRLRSLKISIFTKLENLQTLRVDNNQLVRVKLPFSNLKTLRILYLHDNFLRHIDAISIIEGSSNLKIITLKNNEWYCVDILDAKNVFQNHSVAIDETNALEPYNPNLSSEYDCILRMYFLKSGVIIMAMIFLLLVTRVISHRRIIMHYFVKSPKTKSNKIEKKQKEHDLRLRVPKETRENVYVDAPVLNMNVLNMM